MSKFSDSKRNDDLTLKNSLSGVSVWACGFGTESHICRGKSREIKVNKKFYTYLITSYKNESTVLPSEYLLAKQALNFQVVSTEGKG